MARSEFRYNKKRKHYAYLFKDVGSKVKNIVFTSKQFRKYRGDYRKNVKLYAHPNPNSNKTVYVIPYVYVDEISSFESKKLDWKFNINDKRKIKRIKKRY